MNLYIAPWFAAEPSLVAEIVADPLSPSCYRLLSGSGIQESQRLGPDLSLPRARTRAGGRSGWLRRGNGGHAMQLLFESRC